MSTLEERIAERTRIRDKALEKANQCSEQIKRLEKQKNEQERKRRTHLLIVCGSELAHLFGKVLSKEETMQIVDFLCIFLAAGEFHLGDSGDTVLEEPKTQGPTDEQMKAWEQFFLNEE